MPPKKHPHDPKLISRPEQAESSTRNTRTEDESAIRQEVKTAPGQSDQTPRVKSRLTSICTDPRKACAFFALAQLALNTTFIVLFWVGLEKWSAKAKDGTDLLAVGTATSAMSLVAATFLLVAAIGKVRYLFWPTMILVLLQFVPCAIFFYMLGVLSGGSEAGAIATSCILSIVVLVASLYELMVVVSYYVRLGKEGSSDN